MIPIHMRFFISHHLLCLVQRKRKSYLALEIAAGRQDQAIITLTLQRLVGRRLCTQFLKAEIHPGKQIFNQVLAIIALL